MVRRARPAGLSNAVAAWWSLGALALLVACGDGSADVEPNDAAMPDAASYPGLDPAPWRTTHDFLVTSMIFHAPEGLRSSRERVPNPCGVDGASDNTVYDPLVLDGLLVDGFDLDGDEGAGDGLCPGSDYLSPSGQRGIDFGFLHVMDQIRPARPGQTIEIVLRAAPLQGLVNIGIRLADVDDISNDDHVELLVTTTLGPPLKGTDGSVLTGSSVTADTNPAYQSRFVGRIVDGMLQAGPADVVIGDIDLLVVEDRVVSLKDARMRATLTPRPGGGYDFDAIVGGWWRTDDMVEAIGRAILTIGSNPGELECVLAQHADHSTDGINCDAMSTMLRIKGVSGFITGLDGPVEAME